MATVLKITKPDRSIHIVPIANKAATLRYNNRLPAELKWKIEEIDEKEADKLPGFDKDYIPMSEAQSKLPQLEKLVDEKDKKIAELLAKLEELEEQEAKAGSSDEDSDDDEQEDEDNDILGSESIEEGQPKKEVKKAAPKRKR